MPFGTRITPDGVHFRLWAPGCERVGLCIADGAREAVLPMTACGDGWFECSVPGVGAGTRYRFEVIDGLCVPDPVSRANPDDVHGASEVVDPAAFDWHDDTWRGRPWEAAVVYELHVGTFSSEGTFAGVMKRLDYLVELGVTAIELMPVADFPGVRNWGYDGALLFAPDSCYGRPEDLKALVQAAHAKGLMVLLDVVYNHFGPEGNYLHVYARQFFTERHHTLWGAAINFDGPDSRPVREFFIHNALYWLQEYHFDGLRLDAVHAIIDDSAPHILTELAARVHAAVGPERQVHLILENDANEARYLGAGRYAAQWNDDIHHALHVLAAGEVDGYYADYADAPVRHLGRCLTQGFAYQGEASAYRDHMARGEPSAHLPPQAFVSFLQNHDQVGNRAFGERIGQLAPAPAVRAAAAVYLLAPAIPLLFMGEEFAAATPFRFFCDFGGELREAVTEGRRREFRKFARFADAATQAAIPDPNQPETFVASKLDWDSLGDPERTDWLIYYRELLRLRRQVIVPRLRGMGGHAGTFEAFAPAGLRVKWRLGDGSTLRLLANLSGEAISAAAPPGKTVFALSMAAAQGVLGPWSVWWTLEESP
ncbi:malto-oligosyltrehalose trehalohydrolase [Thiobacillus denitrificans]|uniref:Malto-oligosyltrehalose trehalohydrolase n=1 Tax=Thiobacillus denitrificans TaxID=36861 RepID=A0A106BJ11_THIDE|nr:malto-oligosyltrehalose trehalohydrolase [Thiobacillus denitrificans]KVW93058.1 1,4-alpha-glucan branching protein [Thiobacillus denitrificans]